MRVPGCLTAILALSIWAGALAIGQRLDRTLVELDALSLATPELAAECARLQAKVDLGPALRVELAERKATFARWLTILPRPELATEWGLMERVQQCCEAAQFQMKSFSPKFIRPEPALRAGFVREVDVTLHAMEGTPSQFMHFLHELERSPSFLRVNSFTCHGSERLSRDRQREVVVTVGLNISTFRVEEAAR